MVLLPVASASFVGVYPNRHFCLSLGLHLIAFCVSRVASSAFPAPAESGQPPAKVQVKEDIGLVPWQQWQTGERQRVIEQGAQDSVIGSLYLW